MKRIAFVLSLLLLGMAPAAQSAPVNLAPLGVASGSSEGWGTVFADGNDGNRDGNYSNGSVWHTTGTPEANPPSYYEVDLGIDYYLDRLEIFPRTDVFPGQQSVQNFRITVLDSGNVQVFSTDFLSAGSTGDVAWGTNSIRNVYGQKVRIERLSQNEPNFMTFSEFEVYGQSTPIEPNLATAATVTANTNGGFGTALTDAIDGDIDGNYGHVDTFGSHPIFHADSNRGDEYIQLDLGAAYNLDYINLFSRSDFTGNTSSVRLDVLASDGASVVYTQDLQMQGTDFNGPRYGQTVDLTAVSGQYIRLTALEGGGDRFITFAEIEAFATVIPEPSSLVLAGVAVAAAAWIHRRRRRAG
jgi:hypothetical protein